MILTDVGSVEFLIVSHEGRLLCVTNEDETYTYFRDADSGRLGKIKTALLKINFRSGWWRFNNEELDQARGVADAKQSERSKAKFYLITHTGNVLSVTSEDQLGIQYVSLITQQPGALSHDDVRRGINEQGWELLTDFLDAQIAAAANEDSFWLQGGGWV